MAKKTAKILAKKMTKNLEELKRCQNVFTFTFMIEGNIVCQRYWRDEDVKIESDREFDATNTLIHDSLKNATYHKRDNRYEIEYTIKYEYEDKSFEYSFNEIKIHNVNLLPILNDIKDSLGLKNLRKNNN